MNCVPIVLFTYKRLDITKKTIGALVMNEEAGNSRLIIFSDGPKASKDINQVGQVRGYLRSISGFESVEIIEREKNLGLANSFITGISEVLSKYDSAIFIEDDNLVSPGFLKYMNSALSFYRDNERVGCISGYSFPIIPNQNTPYFIRGAETWSFATWRRSWNYFESDSKKLLHHLRNHPMLSQFRRDGFQFYEMLEQQIDGKIDSWGVRWWTSLWLRDMYCLYPNLPLCVSIGYGEDSVHCKNPSPLFRSANDLVEVIDSSSFPSEVRETFRTRYSLRLMNKVMLPFNSYVNALLKMIARKNG